MKKNLFFCLLTFQFALGQDQTKLSGKVTHQQNPVIKTEIVNLTQKKIASTNNQGKFSIKAQLGDTLVFYAKNFNIEKIIVTNKEIQASELNIILDIKTEELEEIVIDKQARWSMKYIQEIIDRKYVDDLQTSPKNRLIYDGTIENGVDVNRLGKETFKLIKKAFRPKEKPKEITFKKYAITTCDAYYFKNILKLEPDHIILFLDYCDEDEAAKIAQNKNNIFDLMDYLSSKIASFKSTYNMD